MIDFHYGDTFNSVGVQDPPAAWASMSYAQMQTALYNYVYNFCVALKAAGVTPEWIQNGNEINSGICRPTGAIGHASQMAGLLNQGYNAMKKVFPNVKVIIHVAQPQNAAAMTLLDTYKANGGKWDVTGISTYAATVLSGSFEAIKAKHTQELMLVEIGAEAGNPGKAKTLVENSMAEIVKINKACEGGVFYWEPEVYTPFSTRTNNAWDPNTRMPIATMDGYALPITNCSIVTDLEDPIAETSQATAACYPNPFHKDLSISFPEDFDYSLFDMTGAVLEAGKGHGTVQVGSTLPSGMYVLRLRAVSGNKVFKVTKHE
jgi:arabinogalactan endo-1,4-beta-galactosidase